MDALQEGQALLEAMQATDNCLVVTCHRGHRLRELYYDELLLAWVVFEHRQPARAGDTPVEIATTREFSQALRLLQE